jgi:hypothetical protein
VASLREVLVDLDGFVERTCVELAVNLTAELIEVTPVDVGWARANWVPNLGAPYTGSGEPPTKPGPMDDAVQQAGLNDVLAFKLADGAIFVSNRVPYIRRLNDGSSDQAPAGFVEAAVDKVLASSRAT